MTSKNKTLAIAAIGLGLTSLLGSALAQGNTGIVVKPRAPVMTVASPDHQVLTSPGDYLVAVKGSNVSADNHARVDAYDGSFVQCSDGAIVTAYAGSRVEAHDGCKVTAEAGSTVITENSSLVIARPGSHVTVEPD